MISTSTSTISGTVAPPSIAASASAEYDGTAPPTPTRGQAYQRQRLGVEHRWTGSEHARMVLDEGRVVQRQEPQLLLIIHDHALLRVPDIGDPSAWPGARTSQAPSVRLTNRAASHPFIIVP